MKKHNFHKTFIAFVIAGLCLFAASPVIAHRLNIFAWLENDTVLVDCNFGKNSPAKNARITIYDSDTKRPLLEGTTNADGRYAFKVPSVVREGHGLLIDVVDDQGHHNEWLMDASELYAAASLTAGFDQAAIEAQRLQSPSEQSATPSPNAHQSANQPEDIGAGHRAYMPIQPTPPSIQPRISLEDEPISVSPPDDSAQSQPLTHEHVRTIVSEELQKHLSPLHKKLAEQSVKEPGIAEIVGGIGWIIGMVGLFLYFRSRRKQ